MILLTIVKVIGFLLLAIVLLLLTALVCVLFAPVHYKVKAKKREEMDIWVNVSYLLRIVQFRLEITEQKKVIQFLLFGIDARKVGAFFQKIGKLFRFLPHKKKQVSKEEKKTEVKKIENINKNEEKISQEKEIELTDKEPVGLEKQLDVEEDEQSRKNPFFTIKQRFVMIKNRGKKVPEKFNKFVSKGKAVCSDISSWKEFLLCDNSKQLYKILWGQIGYLMKKVMPRKIKGEICFGIGNPCDTAKLYGAYCALSVFSWMRKIKVMPIMEEEILQGEIFAKGYIQGYPFVLVAKRILLGKEWKEFYASFKKKKASNLAE